MLKPVAVVIASILLTSTLAAVASGVSGICWLVGIWTGMADNKIMVTGLAIAGWSAAAAVCLVRDCDVRLTGSQPSNPRKRRRRLRILAGRPLGARLKRAE